ncbi:TPM domain-containing protein [Microbacterium sp. MAHUQ-60]|uniref:TPM domain-containing protein n=1 Tax=unclassified Microbacterium TaxID=2609290 RepID=UPI00361C4F92
MRARTLGVIALAGVIALSTGGTATADTPSALEPGFVTDRSGVLSAQEESRLEQRLSELAASEGVPELYVVLVPDFEDPANALAWADQTALRSNLAPDQYLLAIATEGRTLAISAEYGGDGEAAGPLSESRVLEIEERLGGRYLSEADWAGGVEYVAEEFSQVPWPWWAWVLGLAGLAVLVFLITRLVLFLRQRSALAAERRTLDGQKKQAARQLVRTDEAVRTSEQELGFVTAEFGEETTAEFSAVLEDCRLKLQQGFGLLEKLEDAVEDTPDDTRSWTKEILRICRDVDRALEERTGKLASLRALVENSAKTLDRLRTARAEAARARTDAEARLATLSAAFPPADLISVAENPRQIGERLRDADRELAALEAAIRARRPRAISDSVHEIERLLTEAGALRDAVSAYAEVLAGRSPASVGEDGTSPTLQQAAAAVRAAEALVRARVGGTSADTLGRLYLAQRRLAEARSTTDPSERQRLALAALDAAQQVHTVSNPPVGAAVGGRMSSSGSRFAVSQRAADDGPIMFDPPSAASSRVPAKRAPVDEGPSTGGKALWGAFSGALMGLVGGSSAADGNAGMVVVFIIVGAVLGAVFGGFSHGGSGGSSSGWGGSSRSSYRGGSSRSSFRSSSRSSRSSSRSSGGSRSSGRSGGRRF